MIRRVGDVSEAQTEFLGPKKRNLTFGKINDQFFAPQTPKEIENETSLFHQGRFRIIPDLVPKGEQMPNDNELIAEEDLENEFSKFIWPIWVQSFLLHEDVFF